MKKQLRMNLPFNGRIDGLIQRFKVGQIINIECDDKGIPLDLFWFRRVKDSKTDDCVSFVDNAVASSGKKSRKNTEE